MLKNKKGGVVEFILTPTFTTLLALGIVLLYLLWFVNGTAAKTSFERQFLSKDLSLIIDTILSLPGNFNLLYSPHKPEFQGNFTFMFSNETVTVKDEGENYNRYLGRKDIILKPTTIIPSKEGTILKIIKTGDQIDVSNIYEKKKVFDRQINCYGTHKKINSFILDAGHLFNPESKYNDPGFMNEEVKEADLTLILGQAIKNLAKDFTFEETRFLERATEGKQAGLDTPISITERIEKIKNSQSDALVSLHFGNYDGKFYLKAFVHPKNFEENYKLACSVINEVAQGLYSEHDKEIDGLAVIPLNPDYSGDKNNKVLSAKDGFVLEVGSVQNHLTDKELLTVAKGVIKGLK
ncbi:N-acetylmuramoyl-L-alanine amidase [archaeon]|nr:N-acetylmuramoyl-L-alanine amidase [archaeon]